jgi:hypothetical protein
VEATTLGNRTTPTLDTPSATIPEEDIMETAEEILERQVALSDPEAAKRLAKDKI